jgi:hypothetical protein
MNFDTSILVAAVVTVGLVVLFFLHWTRTSTLNTDPLQNSLMQLIADLNAQGHSPRSRDIFSSLASAHFDLYGIKREGERHARLAHALSFTKLQLRPEDYRQTVRFLETWKTPASQPREAGGPQLHREAPATSYVFVSYAREDKASAGIVVARLESLGFRVWWDASIATGAAWEAAIQKQREFATAVVVLWSPLSTVSEWVRAEAVAAKQAGKLAPFFIRQCRLPAGFDELQVADLSRWSGDSNDPEWRRLISAIEGMYRRRTT